MPVFKQRLILEVAQGVKAFLNLEAGIVRDKVPGSGTRAVPDTSKRIATLTQELDQARQLLASKDREIAPLRARLDASGTDDQIFGIAPENIVWIFGSPRTGSTWLLSMMAGFKGHVPWPEPLIGAIFGAAYYRKWAWQRDRTGFILGDQYKDTWLRSIRSFVLDGMSARLPEKKAEYVVIKEPNGSLGAPLIAQALPESRMIFLVRDPRDVVSSILGANKEGSWHSQLGRADSQADNNPDEFVRRQAKAYMENAGKAKEAYEAHKGRKVVVRYEDLRNETLQTMRYLYSALEVPIDEERLRQIVEKRAWENVPEEKKGPNKRLRKATPGGWKEDLTLVQARIVERTTATILDEFYPGWSADVNHAIAGDEGVASERAKAIVRHNEEK